MKRKILAAVLFSLLITFPASSQDAGSQNIDSTEGESSKKGANSFLLPFLETAFSTELRWRPDWPEWIPPDSFYIKNTNAAIIELFDDTDSFLLKRDSAGRLIEFPFFYANGYAQVKAEYAASGALSKMSILFDDGKTWDITFPGNFLPYSSLSPGGSFPLIQVSSNEGNFYVFIFETPSFLTETWYNSEGNIYAFCKAYINHIENKWRVTTLQIHDLGEVSFEEYFFDSYGNISEIRCADAVFSALYRDNRPYYWNNSTLKLDLHWDAQGFLTAIRGDDVEFRYEYETDTDGCWINRRSLSLSWTDIFQVMIPSGGEIWKRRIVYGE